MNLLFHLFELHPLAGTTYCLHGPVVDIMKVYADISSFIKDVKPQGVILTNSLASHSHCKKQINRDNTEADCLETYYKLVFVIPFTDR